MVTKLRAATLLSAMCLTAATVQAAAEVPGPSSRRTGVALAEIHYHPAPRADGRNLEFIELYNAEPETENIGGWRLTGDIDYTFPSNTVLAGKGRIVVAANPADLAAVHGLSGLFGPFTNSLPDGGGTVRVRNRLGSVLLETDYRDTDPWPVAADGAGHSLVLARPSYGERSPHAWDASVNRDGSPGSAEPAAPTSALYRVVISEVLAHTDPPQEDYVELHNPSGTAVDLGGCVLTDTPTNDTYVLPPGTLLPAGGFVSFRSNVLGFAISALGDELYLRDATNGRVIDCVRFGAQVNGVAWGRHPDAAPGFQELAAVTEAASNAAPLVRAVVINEIHFHPADGAAGVEFIELHNRSAAPVDLAYWRFSDGVDFTFPTGAVLAAGGFAVVTADRAAFLSLYTAVPPAIVHGDFAGSLSDSGERIRLQKPDDPLLPFQDFTLVDEVTYGDGWGAWADGGGSTLELIDPRADNDLQANWTHSDETARAPWVTIETNAVADLGSGSHPPDEVHVLLLGAGEALLDGIEVVNAGGTNLVINGGFEGGITNWLRQGTHVKSALVTNEAFAGANSLRVVASGGGDTGANRIEADLSGTLAQNTTATLRVRARWLRGNPYVLLRVRGNSLDVVGRLPGSARPGSPGATNGAFAANAAPAIHDVAHAPLVPDAGEVVVVTARARDPDGVTNVTLLYRFDPAYVTNSQPMRDDGVWPDAQRGDGLYSAALTGSVAGVLAAFQVRAQDAAGATRLWPAGAPAQEGLVRWGDAKPPDGYGDYHVWMTASNVATWTAREKLSNESLDATFIPGRGSRPVYNAGMYYRGSPFIRPGYTGPTGVRCAYWLEIPKDQSVMGADEFNLDSLEPERDNTHLRELTSFWVADQMGIPSSHQRFVTLFFNGVRRFEIYTDSQQPDSDYIDCHLPDESDGELFKIDDWFEFNDTFGYANVNATLQRFTTTGGAYKQARYRWSWEKKRHKGYTDDYDRLYQLVDALNTSTSSPAYVDAVSATIDAQSWLNIIAFRHVAGDYDGYGYDRGKNMSAYKPAEGPWKLLLWDLDMSLGASRGATDPLFSINDPVIASLVRHPAFQRVYWRAFQRAVDGPLQNAAFTAFVDTQYATFAANAVTSVAPTAVKTWMDTRRSYITQQLATVSAPFAITTSNGADFATAARPFTLAGTAPIGLTTLWIGGAAYPVTWTSVTNWQVEILPQGLVNTLILEGRGENGLPIPGLATTITVTALGAAPSPLHDVVLSEIMYNPASNALAEYVEIANLSSNWFDLGGWRLEGVGFTFPAGSLLGPTNLLLLARDTNVLVQSHGVTIAGQIAGQYNGALDDAGETLRLQRPWGATGWQTVDEVTYDDAAPWPVLADGAGPSLQLIDPTADNRRIGAWTASTNAPWSPGSNNTGVATSLPAFPRIWLNEVLATNGGAFRDRLNDADPWFEVHDQPNVVAVEVHQAAVDDPDLRFSLTLARPGTATVTSTLVAAGAVWSYAVTNAEPAGWKSNAYNSGTWPTGAARLGFGGDGETTTIGYGPDSGNKYITTYFRRPFVVTNTASLAAATLYVSRDDGAVVYLNGTEVFRDNLPTGTIAYGTVALAAAGGAAETTFYSTNVNPALFLNGTNWLAAEVHQNSGSSSDLGFNLALDGAIALTNLVLNATNAWQYLAGGTVPDDDWMQPWYAPAGWSNGPAPLGYGRGGEATLVPSGDPSNRPLTTYYRQVVRGLGLLTNGTPAMTLEADDGAIVYVNGREVFRTNLPEGPVYADTPALTALAGTNTTSMNLPRRTFGGELTNLSGLAATDVATNLLKWSFPSSALPTSRFLVVWADAEPGETTTNELHASFRLVNSNGTTLTLAWTNGGRTYALDHVRTPAMAPDRSYGDYPDGRADSRRLFQTATPGATNNGAEPLVPVRLNEWMAQNTSTLADPADGDFDDWIELLNIGTTTVSLAGLYLTDDLDAPLKWAFPTNATIGPGAFLLVWADDETNQNALANGDLHAAFKLSASGEAVGLFQSNGVPVDSWAFGAQLANRTEGRLPDGTGDFIQLGPPTPRTNNEVYLPNTAPLFTSAVPGPFDEMTVVSFEVSAIDTDVPPQSVFLTLSGAPPGATFDPNTGFFSWSPGETDGPGTNLLRFLATDNGSPVRSTELLVPLVIREANRSPSGSPVLLSTFAGSRSVAWFRATDPDLPAQSLTYNLVAGSPAAATINPTNGALTYTPPLTNAGSVVTMRVLILDDGVPPRGGTGFVTFVVAPLANVFQSNLAAPTGSTQTITWNGVAGANYFVEYSDMIEAGIWSFLSATTAPASGIQTVIDPSATNNTRFYRIFRSP